MNWRTMIQILSLIAFTMAASRIKRDEAIADEGSGEIQSSIPEGSGVQGQNQPAEEDHEDMVKETSHTEDDTLTGTEPQPTEDHSDSKREDASQSEIQSAAQQGDNSSHSLFQNLISLILFLISALFLY